MPKLQGRVALITGAGRGIGRAIAIAFAAEGANVAITARSADELDEVVKAIGSRGGTAMAWPIDIADRSAPKRLVAEISSALGPVEILVNNAGIGSSANPRPVVDYDDEFWELSLLVNLTVPYLLSKAVLPGMLERKWGRIINVASINGKIPSYHGAAYAASKHGLLGLTRTVAVEVAKEGITVNAICPGPVKSRMSDRRVEYDAQRLGRDLHQHEASLTPMGGRLEPEDIAPMAVYLASEDARTITGQSYNIDGGLVLS